jgi:hypothetical protein
LTTTKPAAIATLTVVYDGGQRRCIGHVLSRGKEGFEAFDVADRSIGIFQTQAQAATAVSAEAAP